MIILFCRIFNGKKTLRFVTSGVRKENRKINVTKWNPTNFRFSFNVFSLIFCFFQIFSKMGHTKTLYIFQSSASQNKINSLNISSIQLKHRHPTTFYTLTPPFKYTTKSLHTIPKMNSNEKNYRIIFDLFSPLFRSHLSFRLLGWK